MSETLGVQQGSEEDGEGEHAYRVPVLVHAVLHSILDCGRVSEQRLSNGVVAVEFNGGRADNNWNG